MSDKEIVEAYDKALNAGHPVEGGTIPRSFASGPGQSQSANDVNDGDPDNEVDVATIAAIHYRGDKEAARRVMLSIRGYTTARDQYAAARDAEGGTVGPANPFFALIPRHDQVLQYQVAAGVPRTELNPGLSLEKAKAIYDANPDGPPTDMS